MSVAIVRVYERTIHVLRGPEARIALLYADAAWWWKELGGSAAAAMTIATDRERLVDEARD